MMFPSYIHKMITSCIEYDHDINAKHISVILKNGKIITDYKYNYPRSKIFGIECGSAHAEILAIKELINICCNQAGLNKSIVNSVNYFLNLFESPGKCNDNWYVL